jgi:hypothetical protein
LTGPGSFIIVFKNEYGNFHVGTGKEMNPSNDKPKNGMAVLFDEFKYEAASVGQNGRLEQEIMNVNQFLSKESHRE